ncbi:MAG: hypothetical protein QGH99_12790, partial [Pseudomonadales bacterium]|nr:hypothetical protein [Pseudomonadales bacterium]
MHQIVFVVASDIVESMQIDENPTDSFPCMSTREFHRDARAQLYSLVTGEFLDEAIQMELLDRVFTDDGPYIYRMADPLKVALARLEEDQDKTEADYQKLAFSIPNLLHESVPIGPDDSVNQEIYKWGEIPKFD